MPRVPAMAPRYKDRAGEREEAGPGPPRHSPPAPAPAKAELIRPKLLVREYRVPVTLFVAPCQKKQNKTNHKKQKKCTAQKPELSQASGTHPSPLSTW